MIKYIKNLFKSKEKEITTKKIYDILESKYNEYGSKSGFIYVTKEEYSEYKKIIEQVVYPGEPYMIYFNCKVIIDPAILREEKLNELLK
jgi:hypothetical protein